MSRKIELKEIQEQVLSIWNKEFTVCEYINSKNVIVQDVNTLIKYKVTVANFIKNKHDPRKNIQKKDIAQIQAEINSIYGDEFLLVEYNNANNLMIKDKTNNLYKTTYSHLITERKNPHNLVIKYTQKEIEDLIYLKSNKQLEVVDIYKGMKEPINIKCLICKNTFTTQPTHLIHEHTKCPYCSHQKISFQNCIFNSPYKYKYENFLTEEQMKQYMPHSMQKISVICPICKQKKKIAPDTIFYQNGIGCICGDGISYPNKFMYYFLKQTNIPFEREIKFDWSNNKIYDFYIPSKNIIIEMHGLQHYEGFYNDKSQIKENDIYKRNLAIDNLDCSYFEIDSRKSNIEFISKKIQESGLLELLKISATNINFLECDKFAIKHTILNELIEKYHNDKTFNIKLFANENNISLSLAYKLLNQAINHSLIDYKLKNTYKKKVRCVETGEEFNSIAEANKKYHCNINKALKNKSLAHSYHWELIDN